MMTNTEQQKRMLEVLDETVQYYSEDVTRRSFTEKNRCLYYNPSNGNMCAVGRCLQSPQLLETRVLNKGVHALFDHCPQLTFKPEYQGLPMSFWERLQSLHDDSDNWDYWNDPGLSTIGEKRVNDFKEDINNWIQW